jgi:hypothetical protein
MFRGETLASPAAVTSPIRYISNGMPMEIANPSRARTPPARIRPLRFGSCQIISASSGGIGGFGKIPIRHQRLGQL